MKQDFEKWGPEETIRKKWPLHILHLDFKLSNSRTHKSYHEGHPHHYGQWCRRVAAALATAVLKRVEVAEAAAREEEL